MTGHTVPQVVTKWSLSSTPSDGEVTNAASPGTSAGGGSGSSGRKGSEQKSAPTQSSFSGRFSTSSSDLEVSSHKTTTTTATSATTNSVSSRDRTTGKPRMHLVPLLMSQFGSIRTPGDTC